jgi:hypothetical protein
MRAIGNSIKGQCNEFLGFMEKKGISNRLKGQFNKNSSNEFMDR